ncbi:hypothetical protein BGZ57DRAFT_958666 [Hyaloscypha finlandica]|nr:hypothetical protein BGZ57DRAFT_958666 [Hyaloscypha finlandica]
MASATSGRADHVTLSRQSSSEATAGEMDTMLSRQNSSEKTQLGAKALEIIDVAELIDTSVMKFIASPPDERIDLEAFLQHIQTSARDVRSLSRTLIASDAVGQFVRFPKLPPEIRDKIWKHALEGLRIVEFYATSRATWTLKYRHYKDGDFNIRILQNPHALFHVSHESRAVALKKYSLQLGASTSLANSKVDPKEDLVCFPYIKGFTSYFRDSRFFHESIWSQEALKLEIIAIDSRVWHQWTIAEVLRAFKCLTELVLIVHSFRCELTLEGNQATDLPLKNYPSMTDYQIELDDWWLKHGGIEGGRWAKPKLVGMKLVHDGGKCCLYE